MGYELYLYTPLFPAGKFCLKISGLKFFNGFFRFSDSRDPKNHGKEACRSRRGAQLKTHQFELLKRYTVKKKLRQIQEAIGSIWLWRCFLFLWESWGFFVAFFQLEHDPIVAATQLHTTWAKLVWRKRSVLEPIWFEGGYCYLRTWLNKKNNNQVAKLPSDAWITWNLKHVFF